MDESIFYSLSLSGLKKESGGRWNCNCNQCDETRSRMWFLPSKNNETYNVFCHNCGASKNILTWMAEYFPDIYDEYKRVNVASKMEFRAKKNKLRRQYMAAKKKKSFHERKAERAKKKSAEPKATQNKKIIPKPKKKKTPLTKYAFCLEDLGDDHIANKYFSDRKIPEKFRKDMYFSKNFRKITNKILGEEKFQNVSYSDKRVIIPMYKLNGSIYGFAGRSLEKDPFVKYLTIRMKEYPKIYGLERVDRDKKIYVFEGQIDSMFIENGIAMAGSDLSPEILKKISPIDNFIIVFDNEVNDVISRKISKMISYGFNISLIPKTMRKFGKDINDYVVRGGYDGNTLKEIINENTFKGKVAEIRLSTWRKLR